MSEQHTVDAGGGQQRRKKNLLVEILAIAFLIAGIVWMVSITFR